MHLVVLSPMVSHGAGPTHAMRVERDDVPCSRERLDQYLGGTAKLVRTVSDGQCRWGIWSLRALRSAPMRTPEDLLSLQIDVLTAVTGLTDAGDLRDLQADEAWGIEYVAHADACGTMHIRAPDID